MAQNPGLSLLAVGGDPKRLEWLQHHVTTQWPDARLSAVAGTDAGTLQRLVKHQEWDAVVLPMDFANDTTTTAGLTQLGQLLQVHPDLYCIIIAENGDELAAVRTVKAGARDYLPVTRLTRDLLLSAIDDASMHRRSANVAVALNHTGDDVPDIDVPGYTIVKLIATSNFSSVFLAKSARLRRNVVLKTMKRGAGARERDDEDRFQREYEIISSISHRSIAEIHDFGALPDHLYLSMEYFPCGDLRDRLRNPLSTDESLYYLRAIAEALRVIHVFGILHRDLKPANVMLREDNSPVLIDFGLARRSLESDAVTMIGQIVGSPYYISPEQAEGQPVDVRTDLYSLGVIFYEMLTGQRPYSGQTAAQIMTAHSEAPIPRLPEALALHQPMIDRLLAKNPNRRYASADELLADLAPNPA